MLRFAGFPLSAWAFALRTWAAMMLALYVAFWLQLENGYIVAFTVGILSLQTRGQAYQKALYQLLMTVVGVVASIVIAGLLAQARDLFVIAYGIWLGLCVYVGGLLDGNPHHRISPKKWQNIRLSSDVANPLSRSRNWRADGDGCVGSHLDAAAGSRV